MLKPVSTYLFDSFPLLKLFQKEEGYQKVSGLLEDILEAKERPLIHIINVAEILYLTKKRFGDDEKRRILASLYDMDFDILSANDGLVYQAAELKGSYPISFGDCFALATAINRKAVLVTGDPDFKKVENLVKVLWV